MSNYNPASVDAVLSRIENTLNAHVNETREYRKHNDIKHGDLAGRVSSLEGDKKKLLGLAIGSGIGSGSFFAGVGKLFGGH